jgi:uncharacterized paraquat-inducible protein A
MVVYLQDQSQSQVTNTINLNQVYTIIQEIANKFSVPIPKVVVGQYKTAMYSNGVIYLPINVSPELLKRMVVHEMAHHIHTFYNINASESEAETFASMFEEAYIRSKGFVHHYSSFSCQICRTTIFAYGDKITCPKCHSIYVRKYPHPGIGRALGLAILSGIVTYVLTNHLLSRTEEIVEIKQVSIMSAISSGVVSFIAGLV